VDVTLGAGTGYPPGVYSWFIWVIVAHPNKKVDMQFTGHDPFLE
jgi:hypothetical protein